MTLSPLALFVYNRPEVLKITLEYLEKNFLIEKTKIYVFSDGPKDGKEDKNKVMRVRKLIEGSKLNIKKKIYFKKNKGLKKNILGGLKTIFKTNNKVIVLEDDIITSKYFLKFMNESLDYIKKKDNIWHVGAWNYPIKIKSKDKNKIILNSQMHCWGWGTHKKNWKKIILNSNLLIKKFNNELIDVFTWKNKLNNWSQLLRNHEGQLNSWAIFWYTSIFLNNAMCLTPLVSYTRNIGFGQFSTNTKKKLKQINKINKRKIQYSINVNLNKYYIKKIDQYLLDEQNKHDKKKQQFIYSVKQFFKNSYDKIKEINSDFKKNKI
jgi:GT2 family glycosyltransferase